MKQIFRIYTLIAVAMLTAGQTWAETDEFGKIIYTQSDGGTLEFYEDLACEDEITLTNGKSSALTVGTVYIKAMADGIHSAANVTFTAQVSISSSSLEARAITRGSTSDLDIGQAVTVNPVSGKPGVYSFTMPENKNFNVTVSATFPEKLKNTEPVSYITATGTSATKDAGTVYVLNGTEEELGTSGQTTWYVVPSTATGNNALSYKGRLKLNGDVHLILADGSKMTVGDAEFGASALNAVGSGQLTIYGQANGTGELNVISGPAAISVPDNALTICGGTINVDAGTAFNGKSLVIYGGKFSAPKNSSANTVTNTTSNIIATNVQINGGEVTIGGYIQSGTGDVEINGGKVDVSGIIQSTGGDIILGWTNATDHINATLYQPNTDQDHYVKIADGKVLKYTDGTVKLLHSGIVAPSSISGKELTPYGIFGYCGKTSENGGKNVYWSIALNDDPETDAIYSNTLVIEKNTNTVNQTNFDMSDYDNDESGNFAPWIKPDADGVRSDGLKYPITTVTIADGVTSVGKNAFERCSGLQNVTIGNSVTTIGENAFFNCSGLQNVTIGNDVTTIDRYAFASSGLISISIPAAVTNIQSNAFVYCNNLITFKVNRYDEGNSNPISRLAGGMFDNCNHLEIILVPNETAFDAYKSANGWRDYAAKIAPNEISLAKNASGWGTYCHRYPVNYSLSDGATAYTLNGLNPAKTAVNTEATNDNIVAPLTPLLLNYTAPDSNPETDDKNVTLTALPDNLPETVSGDIIVSNDGTDVVFYGNTTGTTQKHDPYSATADGIPALTSSNNACYILLNGKFVLVDTDDGIPAHRCVLSISNSNAARVLAIGIDDETTGVESEKVIVNSEEFAAATDWYDLQGRKLDGKPTKKGLYIYKGKKTVISKE